MKKLILTVLLSLSFLSMASADDGWVKNKKTVTRWMQQNNLIGDFNLTADKAVRGKKLKGVSIDINSQTGVVSIDGKEAQSAEVNLEAGVLFVSVPEVVSGDDAFVYRITVQDGTAKFEAGFSIAGSQGSPFSGETYTIQN